MGDTAARRFTASFDNYLESVVTQAADRDTKRVRNIDSYLCVRRRTIGALPSFAVMEAGLDIPDAVMNLPAVMELTNVVVEMLCIGNVKPSNNKYLLKADEN
jgi:hypothetical protein